MLNLVVHKETTRLLKVNIMPKMQSSVMLRHQNVHSWELILIKFTLQPAVQYNVEYVLNNEHVRNHKQN
jgi:hypothetical protein